MPAPDDHDSLLRRTPLHALHVSQSGKMVPFAGYDMPVQYPAGVLKEHLHTRASAGLFDVSHMGQIALRPKSGKVEDAARALERLVPQDIIAIAPGRQRYAQFTNADGGILDDLMVANFGDHLFLVVNAACKDADEAHLRVHLSEDCVIDPLDGRALIALQGPKAETTLAKWCAEAPSMKFMDAGPREVAGLPCFVSRSGYTGEDGFEISVPAGDAERLAKTLLENPDVLPIGLGARDSLRLEAGLCLYGHDIDTTTTPVEAALEWSVQKSRRSGGTRAGGFPGAEKILAHFDQGASRRRVGLRTEGRAPVREGALLFADATAGEPIGKVTSGGFGPSLNAPVAMGYVPTSQSALGTKLFAEVRGQRLAVEVAAMPFVKNTYKR
ncbi:glycine cleavage system aminomethyltransferase GcvT [Bradyrhizobium sp. 182]|uniref:glycine cleavage system aminomethyltransferase GcvT n=1 Tax=unclassified Bradyrhizobium TaxID=2631580 RepID=UPI001FFBF5A3|nr:MULTISPECIES: glycine cleavage system aminomethyltransferase GcvT [unclassified Bradyrhizobium]MCK1424337.1 glycine cleavage system aminomethyltransferase GcvT [Bradyrhizobium sp. CW12]MCK1529115.1 glycine cleavage system aminomethyltransferase GcvT [Bradyrhizobium sp. 182]MCK1649408.1 glycine cleavage system aminomethyltransferase GcvT [Bradyrhizobium sp. 154]